jgi:hypothetical protein
VTQGAFCVLNLTRQLRPGTEALFRETYDAHHAAMHRYIARLCADASLADDACCPIPLRNGPERSA